MDTPIVEGRVNREGEWRNAVPHESGRLQMCTGYLCQTATTSSVLRPGCSCVVEQLSLSPPLKWATNRDWNDAWNTHTVSTKVCVSKQYVSYFICLYWGELVFWIQQHLLRLVWRSTTDPYIAVVTLEKGLYIIHLLKIAWLYDMW